MQKLKCRALYATEKFPSVKCIAAAAVCMRCRVLCCAHSTRKQREKLLNGQKLSLQAISSFLGPDCCLLHAIWMKDKFNELIRTYTIFFIFHTEQIVSGVCMKERGNRNIERKNLNTFY